MLTASEQDGFYTLGEAEQTLTLPSGGVVEAYAEVALDATRADIVLAITEGERDLGIRCGHGVVVSYRTQGGWE